jgi:DNA modification methylase
VTLAPFFRSGPLELFLGDALELLPLFEARSFTACVTDPPYGLEFMGKDWERWRIDDTLSSRFRGERAGDAGAILEPGGGITPPLPARLDKHRGLRVVIGAKRRPSTSRCQNCGRRDVYRKPHAPCGERAIWRREIIDPHASPPTALAYQEWTRAWGLELYRVLRPGSPLLVFGSPRTFHRLAAGLEDAGFELRRSLAWLYGQGLPKSARIDFLTGKSEWAGWATDLRTGWEPILLFQRPHADGFKGAALEEGGAGVHLGAAGLTAEGDWPSDVLLDEAAAGELGPERAAFFYTAKASPSDRSQEGAVLNDHPTVKPLDLMRWLVELVRRPGKDERILDPFAGSGSTLIAAARLGMTSVGIEREERYATLVGKRFMADAPLFHEDETPPAQVEQLDLPMG